MQTKQQIQAVLGDLAAHPRHSLGQNFLIDGNLMRLVAEAGELSPAHFAIEVGPGTGSLTEELLSIGCPVLAVELDRILAQHLREHFADQPLFTLIEGDALAGKHALNAELLQQIKSHEHVRLVANLPYQIASPLVIEMLIAGVELLAFTVQKEVGQRLKAGVGHDLYGPLSVMAQLLSEVEILRTLPPQAFWPQPKIDSALVRMRRRDRLGENATPFGAFLHRVFSYRRKMLRKAMLESDVTEAIADAALSLAKIRPDCRPEKLGPQEWLQLFESVRCSDDLRHAEEEPSPQPSP